MPQYDFQCDHCDTVAERTFTMSKVKARIRCMCGKMAKRVYHIPNKRVMFHNWLLDPNNRNARVTRGRGY